MALPVQYAPPIMIVIQQISLPTVCYYSGPVQVVVPGGVQGWGYEGGGETLGGCGH